MDATTPCTAFTLARLPVSIAFYPADTEHVPLTLCFHLCVSLTGSRKIKCSGGSVCSTCIRHSKTCVYTPVDEQANQQARERKALYRARMKQRLGSTNTKGSKRGADRTIQLELEPPSSSGQRRSSAYRHEHATCCASCTGKQTQPEPVSIRACNGHVCHAVCHETLPLAGWSSPFTRRQVSRPTHPLPLSQHQTD